MSVLAALCVAVAAAAGALVATGYTRRHVVARAVCTPSRRSRGVWLHEADASLTATQFWTLSVGTAVVVFTALAVITDAPVVAVVPAGAAGCLPHVFYAHRRTQRLRASQEAWPDALRELLANIVAGRALGQAIGALGTTGPDPLRTVFADFAVLSRMFGTAAALEQVKERLADPTSDRVIEVLIVAHERGGGIVRDVLEDLVVATTKDLQVLDEIDTAALEMRINARAVLVLPWLVLVALTMRAGPFRDFYRSRAGALVLVLAGLLSVAGSAWLARLGRRPEEPRVFAPVVEAADA